MYNRINRSTKLVGKFTDDMMRFEFYEYDTANFFGWLDPCTKIRFPGSDISYDISFRFHEDLEKCCLVIEHKGNKIQLIHNYSVGYLALDFAEAEERGIWKEVSELELSQFFDLEKENIEEEILNKVEFIYQETDDEHYSSDGIVRSLVTEAGVFKRITAATYIVKMNNDGKTKVYSTEMVDYYDVHKTIGILREFLKLDR